MSIREQLARKRVRRETYLLAVDDDTDAQARLTQARQDLVLAGLGKGDDNPAKARAQAAVEQAQAAVDACYVPLIFQGLPASEFEALTAAHPSKSDDPDEVWDKDGLTPDLVAACLVDNDMTAEEWRAELAGWTRGDLDALFVTAMRANIRPVGDLGKG